MEAAQRKMEAALTAPRQDCFYVTIFGCSHVRRVYDDCADDGTKMKSNPQSGEVLRRMFYLPSFFVDQAEINMYGVGGLNMRQFWDNYYEPSFSVSQSFKQGKKNWKLFNISSFFQQERERGTHCIILQIGDNDVDYFVEFQKTQLGPGQSLNAKTVAGYIANEIFDMAQFLQVQLGASHVYLLPLMPRYIQGQVEKTVKIDDYNAVAELVNSDLKTLDHDVVKFFHAGKKFHFTGDSYLDRADHFADDGVHLKMGQTPRYYGWIRDNMRRCMILAFNDRLKKKLV